MRRVVVVGASGFFGDSITSELSSKGIEVSRASRSGTLDLLIDPESTSSLRATLRPGDIVVDAAGPYQQRSSRLLETTIAVGCDLIDIADSLSFVESVQRLRPQIESAGIRVFTACSSVSAVSAAAVKWSGFETPRRVRGFLAPASRRTATTGTASSLLKSVGNPIRILDNGELMTKIGWSGTAGSARSVATPRCFGYLFETPDALLLPQIWSSLERVDFYVDTQVFGLNRALRFLVAKPRLVAVVERALPLLTKLSRGLGSTGGCLAFEVEGEVDELARVSFSADSNSHFIAVAPAVLTTQALLNNEIAETGLVPADRYFTGARLHSLLSQKGISSRCVRERAAK